MIFNYKRWLWLIYDISGRILKKDRERLKAQNIKLKMTVWVLGLLIVVALVIIIYLINKL